MIVFLILMILGAKNGSRSSYDCNCLFICIGCHNMDNCCKGDCDCGDSFGTIYKFKTICPDCGTVLSEDNNREKAKPLIILGIIGLIICGIGAAVVISNSH